MNTIKTLQIKQFGTIRMTVFNGESWFSIVDITKVLTWRGNKPNYSVVGDNKIILRKKDFPDDHSKVGSKGLAFTNHEGVCALVKDSKLPKAPMVQDWLEQEAEKSTQPSSNHSNDINNNSTTDNMDTQMNSNKESNAVIEVYNGFDITFLTGESNMMVNATEMAKPFGKTPKDWLRTSPSQEYIYTLSSVRHICLTQLVVVRKGNSGQFAQGTWMHEDVALEFARWLSPEFAIWCNDRIKTLIRNHHVSIDDHWQETTASVKPTIEQPSFPTDEQMDFFVRHLERLDRVFHLTDETKLKLYKQFLVNPNTLPMPDNIIGGSIHLPNDLLREYKISLTIDQFYDLLRQKGMVRNLKVLMPINVGGKAENFYAGIIEGEGMDYAVTYRLDQFNSYTPAFYDDTFKQLCLMLVQDSTLKLKSPYDFN